MTRPKNRTRNLSKAARERGLARMGVQKRRLTSLQQMVENEDFESNPKVFLQSCYERLNKLVFAERLPVLNGPLLYISLRGEKKLLSQFDVYRDTTKPSYLRLRLKFDY